ncbi:UNVERIFIED_ORG: hypothetical protein E4P37_00375 [Bacillus sp. AZ43]
MRRLAAVLCGALALGALGAAPSASAAPAPELCTPEASRGAVPHDFAVAACVDAGSVVVRNDLDLPVVLRSSGDIGAPLPVHADQSSTAAVLRATAVGSTVLVPGDVVRWPLGPGAAELSVALLPTGLETSILRTIEMSLPVADDPADSAAMLAPVVDAVAPAVADRAACATGKNFLQVAACDVVVATTIGRSVFDHLPWRSAKQVQPLLTAPDRWVAWQEDAAADRRAIEGRVTQLVLGPVPPPSPPPVPAPAPAPPVPAPPAPATVPAVPVPVPEIPVVPEPGAHARQRVEQLLRDFAEWVQENRGPGGRGPGGRGHR